MGIIAAFFAGLIMLIICVIGFCILIGLAVTGFFCIIRKCLGG